MKWLYTPRCMSIFEALFPFIFIFRSAFVLALRNVPSIYMRSSVCSHRNGMVIPFSWWNCKTCIKALQDLKKTAVAAICMHLLPVTKTFFKMESLSAIAQSRIYFFPCSHRRTGNMGVNGLVHFQLHAPQSASNIGELCIVTLLRTAYNRHAWGNESIENVRVNLCKNYIQCCICVNHVSLLQ